MTPNYSWIYTFKSPLLRILTKIYKTFNLNLTDFAQPLKWNDELQARDRDETYDLNCWQEERERKEQEDQRKKRDEDAKKKKALTNKTHQYGGIQQKVSVYQHINTANI